MSISSNQVLDTLFVVAPQFYSVDTDVLAEYDAMITLLQGQVNQTILVCNVAMIYAYLLAHYLTLAQNPNLGIASDLTEGQLKIGYNVNPEINFMLLTPYGRAYLDLIKRTIVGTTVTNLPPQLGGTLQRNPLGCGCNGNFGGGWGGWGWGQAGW